MATSFDDAFPGGFGDGSDALAADFGGGDVGAPDQNFLQQLNPGAADPSTAQFDNLPEGTDINGQAAQNFSDQNFGATPQFTSGQANQPSNFLAHLLGLNPDTVSNMAARIGGGANQAAQGGGAQPGYIAPQAPQGQGDTPTAQPTTGQPTVAPQGGGFLGQQSAPPPIPVGSGANPHRPKLSLVDTIGRLADVFANVGGAKAQYQPYIDSRVKTQQDQQTTQLDQQAKQADITQTGVATRQNANEINHGYATALQSIAQRGGDPSIAAGPLAQQLGIPADQAAAVIANYKNDPKSLDDLVTATDEARKGGATGRQLALNYTPAIDQATGKTVFLQPGADGLTHPVAGYTPLNGVMNVDNGTTNDVIDKKTGATVRTFAKSGAPESGTVAGPGGTYSALPGSSRALGNQKTTVEIQKDQAAAAAAQSKTASAAQASQTAYDGSTAALDRMAANVQKLKQMGATTGSGNAVGSMVNALQASTLGQTVGLGSGSAAANLRKQISSDAQSLFLNAAKGNGQLFRNQTEQKAFLTSVNSPTSSYETQMAQINAARGRLGPRPGGNRAAAPAAPAKGGWGTVQVTP